MTTCGRMVIISLPPIKNLLKEIMMLRSGPKLFLAVIGILIFTFWESPPAYGGKKNKIIYDECVDSNGNKVEAMFNTSLHKVAEATRISDSSPVIVYNIYELEKINPQTRLFFYAHECAHLNLGHPVLDVTRKITMEQEKEADCWAVKTLTKKKLLKYNDLSVVRFDISRFKKKDWKFIAGPVREINLRKCLGR